MADASAYPLLRVRRRRRLARLSTTRHGRLLAILVLGAALIGGVILARRPREPDVRVLLADTLKTLAAGNYSAARHNGERAVGAAPQSGMAHVALARALLELGNGLAAEAELGRAEAAGTFAARLHPLLAHARLLQGDAAGAIAEANQAHAADAVYAGRIRARALAMQGQGAAARAALTDIATRAATDAAAWTDLGRLRMVAGDLGGATEAAARAVRYGPGEPGALTLQGEVVRARYGLVAALPWFEAALRRDAYYPPALVEAAATLGDLGRNADALATTRKLLRAQPGNGPALYLQAVIAARAGKLDLAARLLAAGDAVRDLPGAMLLAGALDEVAGRHEQAVAQWRALIAVQPLNLTARRLLGEALLRSRDPRGALEVLRPVALRADADRATLTLAARALEVLGERGPAARLLDRADGGGGGAPALFAVDDSVGSLALAAATARGDPTYALGVIRGLAAAGDRAGAVAKARGLAMAAPGAPAAELAWGDTLAATGDYRAAATLYVRAANLAFDEPTTLRLLDALGRTGKQRDAAAALALYLRQNPQSLTGRRLLGHLQVGAGAWDAAIETLEGVRVRVGNRDAGLLAELALAYAGGDEGAIARRYGAAAFRLAPMDAAACDAYGVALAADGELGGARQLFDKAVALSSANPAYRAHRRQLG